MSYTTKMVETLSSEYLSNRALGLTNQETVETILKNPDFAGKTKKSIIAKLGSLKLYKADEKVDGNSKANLVNMFITMTGLPRRHYENLMRLNKDVLEDMVEIEKARLENVVED